MARARSEGSMCAKEAKSGLRVEVLEAFGIDEQVVELWKSAGYERLLPVQVAAIREFGVLDGDNVLVFSPTSSGKTYVCGGPPISNGSERPNRRRR